MRLNILLLQSYYKKCNHFTIFWGFLFVIVIFIINFLHRLLWEEFHLFYNVIVTIELLYNFSFFCRPNDNCLILRSSSYLFIICTVSATPDLDNYLYRNETHSECPVNVRLQNPVELSQSFMSLSLETEMRKSPCDENSTAETVCSCPNSVLKHW